MEHGAEQQVDLIRRRENSNPQFCRQICGAKTHKSKCHGEAQFWWVKRGVLQIPTSTSETSG
jgi:hypothetical protein